ncbi:MAG: relaxase/mobilization nuclease domain-containing protein [Bacteroidota bacterium]
MIGKIATGKSFSGCLSYLHEGRLQESEELQLEEMERKQAEVILYNQCFGNKKQVVRQLIEVSKLNPNVSKPVFHASLSLAHADGNLLNKQQKADIGASLAEKFGFDQNQYVVITHADTEHEHLHIVANRIGYDGKTASDSNSYKRMAEFCREMEKVYGLQKVLSPNRFLAKEQRLSMSKRVDKRKELLKENLEWAIGESTNVKQVCKRMEKQGYAVDLGRGIAFTDPDMVRFKGSQVGFSLADIEKKLVQQQQMRLRQEQKELKLQQELLQQKTIKRDRSQGISF